MKQDWEIPDSSTAEGLLEFQHSQASHYHLYPPAEKALRSVRFQLFSTCAPVPAELKTND